MDPAMVVHRVVSSWTISTSLEPAYESANSGELPPCSKDFFYIPQMTEAFGALYNCPAVREVIAIKRLMPRVSSRSLMHTQDEVRAVLTAAFALITERIAAFQPGLSSLNLDMIEPFFTHFLFLGGADDTLPR